MQGKFHQYHLTAELAQKHSHSTYLASPVNQPERQVVLIVFAASLFPFPHDSEKLLQKAERVKELEHPHLLPILDTGIEKEQPFVVREYLPNRSLRSRLKQSSSHRLEPREALTIVSQVGQALIYAHEHDILHGNIKPENILFDAHGRPVLTDFSLINKADYIIRDQTSEEYAFCYLAPEQFAGISDAKSDQYALGCLAYELIMGQVPFAAQSLASMMGQSNNTQPIPFSERVPDLPPSLETAVLKTLAKDPADRFFDFSLFLEIIQSVLSPPPSFPLIRSPRPHQQRTTSHPVQLAKAKPASPSSHKPSVSQSLEPSGAVFSTEVAMLEQTETISAPELVKPTSEDDLYVSLLSSEFDPLVDSEPFTAELAAITTPFTKEQKDDLLFTDLSIEEANTPPVKVPENSVDRQDEATPSKLGTSSTKSSSAYGPETVQPVRIRHGGRRTLGLVLLLSVITGSIAYAAFSPLKIIPSGMLPHSTQQVPIQANNTLSPQPSEQATLMVTSQALTQATPQTTSIAVLPSSAQIANAPVAQSIKQVTNAPSPQSPPKSPSTSAPAPTPSPKPTPTTPASYEAEASQNTLTQGASVVACSACSGGDRVGYIGLRVNTNINGILQFNNIWEPNSSNYTITVYYLNGDANGSRTAYLLINGAAQLSFTAPGLGNWNTVGTYNLTVSLSPGENTIEFYNQSDKAPDIDRIVV